MLLTTKNAQLIGKYLEPIGDDVYRLKSIPKEIEDRNLLLEMDELQVLCYGNHMIADYQVLEEKTEVL